MPHARPAEMEEARGRGAHGPACCTCMGHIDVPAPFPILRMPDLGTDVTILVVRRDGR